jgi:hypothetical protein
MTNVYTPYTSLPEAISLAGDEIVAIVQGGTTVQTTVAAIAGFSLAGTYADNAAALAGGLVAGQFYSTVTGEVRVVV